MQVKISQLHSGRFLVRPRPMAREIFALAAAQPASLMSIVSNKHFSVLLIDAEDLVTINFHVIISAKIETIFF